MPYPPIASYDVDRPMLGISVLSAISEEKSEDMPSTTSVSSSVETGTTLPSSKTSEITETSSITVTTPTTTPTKLESSVDVSGGGGGGLESLSINYDASSAANMSVREFIRQMMHPLPAVRIETVDTTQSTVLIDFVLLDQKGKIIRTCSTPKSGLDKPSDIGESIFFKVA